STVNGVLLRPMPVPHPEQLAVLGLQEGKNPAVQSFSYPDFLDMQKQAGAFSDMVAFKLTLASLTADNRGDHCVITRVTGNYFSALGVKPAAGRLIAPNEGQVPGADPVVVLGHSFWQRRFGGDTGIVGRKVEIDGLPATVVGVAEKGFRG